MHRIKEVIVVEGRYDKNTLSQVVDAVIIETAGFGVYSDKEKLELLRKLALARGLIILTDSDGAGFQIRGYLKGAIDSALVKHAYIPDLRGKERRKASPSKEGKLGVEGMRPEVLLDALRRAGATFIGAETGQTEHEPITKADLYALGLSGTPNSSERRRQLTEKLELPERLAPNSLLDVLNALFSREELLEIINSL